MPKVRDAILLVEQDGWSLVRTKGSHRVPASGQARNRDHCRQAKRRPAAGHLEQQKSPRNYAAYVPDLPGCVATGASEAEAVREISEAIRFHVESLREHHEPVPEPRCTATVVDVVAVAR